jgi:hypothetical protein
MKRYVIAVEDTLRDAETVRVAVQDFLAKWAMDDRYEARCSMFDGLWHVSLLDKMPSFPPPARARRLIEELTKRSRDR